jgi:hypothetical protein
MSLSVSFHLTSGLRARRGYEPQDIVTLPTFPLEPNSIILAHSGTPISLDSEDISVYLKPVHS